MEVIGEESIFRRFIVFLDAEISQCNTLNVPEQYVYRNWPHIPLKIKLMLPTGKCFPVHYIRESASITNVAEFMQECRQLSGSIIVFGYRNCGTFLVSILCKEGSEVDYKPNVKNDMSIPLCQDKILGNGWNFLSIANESLLYDGEIDIPAPYYKRFRKVIPLYVLYGLYNGTQFKGRYSFGDRKLCELMDLVMFANVEEGDVLIFKLCGYGVFDITIFNKSRLEKNEEYVVKSEPYDDIGAEDVTGIAVYNDSPDHQIDDRRREFTVLTTKSNIDNTCHGVYIPKNITPANRQWMSNEEVTLRTEHGEWKVGIVKSRGLARFSKGWNSFTNGNELKHRQTLVFNLVNDEENETVFNVELH